MTRRHRDPIAHSSGLAADHLAHARRRVPIDLDRPMELAPGLGLRLDYGQLADLIVRTSAGLASAGVLPGSIVAVVKQNAIDICVIALAAQRIGAVPALLSSTISPADARSMLRTLAPTLLVTDQATMHDGALAGLDLDELSGRVQVLDGEGADRLADSAAATPPPVPPRSVDQPTLITHTSGTTGVPKLVVQSVASFQATVRVNTLSARLCRIGGPIAARLSYVHVRSMAGVAALLELTAPLLALTTTDPKLAVAALRRFKPLLIEANPSDFVEWEPFAASPDSPFASVQYFVNNFDAAHPRTVKTLLGASGRRHPVYLQVYGQSESGPVTMRADTRLTAEHADGRCVGYPVPGHSRFRITPTGAIEVRSKGLALDYLGRHEAYAAKCNGSWWDMGDVGVRSKWRCLHLLDRGVDVAAGVTSLLAIEDQLLERLPNLQEAVLIGDATGDPVPLVCTYDGVGVSAETWRRAIADLPALGDPVYCTIDQLPRTATGKVQRLHLAAQLREGAFVGGGK